MSAAVRIERTSRDGRRYSVALLRSDGYRVKVESAWTLAGARSIAKEWLGGPASIVDGGI